MDTKRTLLAAAIAATALVGVPTAHAAGPVRYPSCKALNAVYPHGVGKAKGLVNKGGKPVKYTVNKAVYLVNTGRDRDKDGIACEK